MLATPNSPTATVPLAPKAEQLSTPPKTFAETLGKLPPRPVELIVIHCSATPSGKPLAQGTPGTAGFKRAVNIIDGWHKERGFARRPADVQVFSKSLPHIGYHYVVDLDGSVWSGRGLDEVGAHAQYFNARSVGICLVGGAERDAQYTALQWKSLAEVVAMLLAEYKLKPRAPKRTANTANPTGYSISGGVCGHRDVSPDINADGKIESFEWLKTCPGFDVTTWLKNGMQPTAAQICEVKV